MVSTDHKYSVVRFKKLHIRNVGSIHVSGNVPTLPWVRFRVLVRAELGLGLSLREGE